MNLLGSLFHKKNDGEIQETNHDLVSAMQDVASNDNPESRKRLYEALLAVTLFVPVPEIPSGLGPGLQTVTSATQIQLTGMTDAKGARLTPAFTDVEALRNWDPNTPYIGIRSRDLFRSVLSTNIQAIVINPFDPIRKMVRPGGRLNRAEFAILAEGATPTRVGAQNVEFQLKANEKVFIGKPAIPPSLPVEQLLRKTASDVAEIAALYVFQMSTQAGPSHTVVGIDLHASVPRERQAQIAGSLSQAVRKELGPGQSLDLMFLGGSLREQIISSGTIIFERH
jgi:hypothetical protein